MTTSAVPAQPGPNAVFAALRAGASALAGLFVVMAVALAALAAALVGLLIAFAAMALRLRPRRREPDDGAVLEGRKTADGWVIEARAR